MRKKKIKGFLISNRAFNYLLKPIINRNKKIAFPYTYIAESRERSVVVTIDSPWSYTNHLILDIVGYHLYKKHYKKGDKSFNTWRNPISVKRLKCFNSENITGIDIPQELVEYIPLYKRYLEISTKTRELAEKGQTGAQLYRQLSNEEFEIQSKMGLQMRDSLSVIYEKIRLVNDSAEFIEIDVDETINAYIDYFGKNRRVENIHELITKTSRIKFTIDGYATRIEDPNDPLRENKKENARNTFIGGRIKNEYILVKESNIFNCEFDGKKCRISFNTPLGNLHVHNILTLNTDWLPREFLLLNDNTAFLYRKFFSTIPGNQPDYLMVKDILGYFDYKNTNNSSYYQKRLNTWLCDLKRVGLIGGFEIANRRGSFSNAKIDLKYGVEQDGANSKDSENKVIKI